MTGGEDFIHRFTVSRETYAKLETYHALLLKWQKAINLVSPKTLGEAWERHFADSAQLTVHIPADTKTLIDLGSGAGFPGLVLAILSPDLSVHMVESDERKCQFLRTVSRETSVECFVHNQRIESFMPGFVPDIITARALAELKDLLAWCEKWAQANPALTLLFLKGRGADAEIAAARETYDFACETIPSVTAPDSAILRITGLKRRH